MVVALGRPYQVRQGEGLGARRGATRSHDRVAPPRDIDGGAGRIGGRRPERGRLAPTTPVPRGGGDDHGGHREEERGHSGRGGPVDRAGSG